MKIAIVGASKEKWSEKDEMIVKKIIFGILKSDIEVVLVSGHSPKGGVDIWAEEVANKYGIKNEIYKPETFNWSGFKKRNILIAQNCDILYAIEPVGRKHSGGLWTLNYAKKLGKPAFKIEIG